MNCRRYVDLISRYVDDSTTERERADMLAHLQKCPDCAATLARSRQAALLASRLTASSPSSSSRAATLRVAPSGGTAQPLAARYAVVLVALLLVAGFVYLAGVGGGKPSIAGTPRALNPEAEAGTNDPDGQRVVEALRELFAETGRPPLPSYLPLGTKVEEMSLGRGEEKGGPYKLDLALRLSDGGSLLVRHSPDEGRPVPPPGQARTLLISGREWRYLSRGPSGYGEAPVHVLVGEVDGAVVMIESALPLDDLVRVAESIQ